MRKFRFLLAPVAAAVLAACAVGPNYQAPETPAPAKFDGADANHDGALSRDEFVADSLRFFAVVDTDHNGVIDGFEVSNYETRIAPEIIGGAAPSMRRGPMGQGPEGGDDDGPRRRPSGTNVLQGAALFGLIALLLIESLRFTERVLRRFERWPYRLAAGGGVALVGLYLAAGSSYAGLGTDTINGVITGTTSVRPGAFLVKIAATAITLEVGGSGGIVTPIFFVGATSGAALAPLFGTSPALLAAMGLVAVLAAAANTPIAAAVMAMELLPGPEGVYAALAAATAFLMVGHRSVYASQKIGLSKSAGLDVVLGGPIGDFDRSSVRIRKGSFTERVHQFGRARPGEGDDEEESRPTPDAPEGRDR